MLTILQWTAWPMKVPALYGPFHLLFFIIGTCLACGIALFLSLHLKPYHFDHCLFTVGVILTLGEIYKQLFFFYVLNNNRYDWWLFPFQLCSLPMYLCLLLPFVTVRKQHTILCTFLLDFNMMGAIATFIDPSGIFHGFWTLTLHGVIWHLLLIFMGFFIFFTGQADLSKHGFRSTLPLFAVCCVIAEILNISLHNKGSINMFYISPFEESTQLLFSTIDAQLGRPIGLLLYIAAMVCGAYLMHRLASLVTDLAQSPYLLHNSRDAQQINTNRHGHH